METLSGMAPHWFWLALGLLLAVGEMAIPGVFLIWMAAAAIITGLLAWATPIAVAWQVVVFVALAIALVFAGRRYLASNPIVAADPLLNDRGARALGETVTITHAIDSGTGRARLGDSEWQVKGPDAEPGTKMRVCGHEGTVLMVEHLH